MKFIVNIENQKILLTFEQMGAIVKMLEGAEMLTNKYVGDKQGEDGTGYLKLIEQYNAADSLGVHVISNEYYETRKLVTKLHMERK
jgi:hypothetical protein